jgi:hypothetical protein
MTDKNAADTKGKAEEVKASGTEVAVANGDQAIVNVAPVDMGVMDLEDFGNTGFEGSDKDSFAIPFIQILQKMSPLVDEDDAKYITGAKAGMLFNSVTQKLYDGKKGFHIIPCAYKRTYILWGGREGDGGFKGEFTVDQVEAMRLDETKIKVIDGKMYVPSEDGTVNEKKNDYYADTRSHFVIVIDPDTQEYGAAILSLSSSQIKASKKLMTSLQQKKVQTTKGMMTPPTFANMVKVTTVGLSNDKGTWSGVNFELDGLVTDKNHYAAAKEFYKAVVGGEVGADYSKADAASAKGDGDVNDQPSTADGF